jgi:uncharacterized lipoprotein YehR (DUF1307 family)
MKKFFALLLVVCLVFALAGCGGSKSPAGTWQAKINLAEVAGDELAELKDYLKDANVDLALEMREDKTYTLSMDGTALKPVLKDAFRAYLNDMLTQMGMTAEDFESLSGQSIDAMIDEALEQMDTSELNKSVNGTYTEDGGKVTLTPESGTVLSGTWEGDTLTLHDDDLGDIAFTRK